MRRAGEAFIGNTEAAELLGVKPQNVRKMLVRYGVDSWEVMNESRKVHLYHRGQVENVQKLRLKNKRKRRDNGGE